jgi:putative spermidine/putrescine transport system permease protein
MLARYVHLLLLAPAVTVTGAVFWVSMLILLVMSVYPFLGSGSPRLSAAPWVKFATDGYYWSVVATTLQLAALVTFFTLLLGYPAAYAMVRIRRPGLLLGVYLTLFSPILVSVVVRTYGWLILLGKDGVVNFIVLRAGIVGQPLQLIFNTTGIVIAMVHILLPFMIFPILSVIAQLSPEVKEAAMDLGATPWQTFRRVTLPLSLPGMVAGSQIVFTLTMSAFVTPFLMGGGKIQVLSGLIYRDMEVVNLAFASVTAFVLLGLSVGVLLLSNRLVSKAYARAEVARG